MAVPKKKRSKQHTKTQYSAFERLEQKRLSNNLNIVTCPTCNARIPERTICSDCGQYKGKQLINKKASSNVTVITAD